LSKHSRQWETKWTELVHFRHETCAETVCADSTLRYNVLTIVFRFMLPAIQFIPARTEQTFEFDIAVILNQNVLFFDSLLVSNSDDEIRALLVPKEGPYFINRCSSTPHTKSKKVRLGVYVPSCFQPRPGHHGRIID
jgi:hypothetical protein